MRGSKRVMVFVTFNLNEPRHWVTKVVSVPSVPGRTASGLYGHEAMRSVVGEGAVVGAWDRVESAFPLSVAGEHIGWVDMEVL